MNPITLPKLTKASAGRLAANWPWAQAYWTTRHADATLLYEASLKLESINGIAFREVTRPDTRKHGWLLVRVE